MFSKVKTQFESNKFCRGCSLSNMGSSSRRGSSSTRIGRSGRLVVSVWPFSGRKNDRLGSLHPRTIHGVNENAARVRRDDQTHSFDHNRRERRTRSGFEIIGTVVGWSAGTGGIRAVRRLNLGRAKIENGRRRPLREAAGRSW